MSAIKMVSFCGIWLLGSSPPPPVIKMTTIIHPMHMQIDRNLDKNVAGALTHVSCLHETD